MKSLCWPELKVKHNPLDYRICAAGSARIPRFPGKNRNHSRRLAKAAERCKIVENFGKYELFWEFSGYFDKLESEVRALYRPLDVNTAESSS
jgi:hypothetical protein